MTFRLTRRHVLQAAAALPLAAQAWPARAGARRLVAGQARVALVGAPHPETEVWCYDGKVPGPELRFRQGDRLGVTVENRLAQDTTVHWHGIRVPNAMDGVPHLTQPPIEPGGEFVYQFDLPDAGTYWYHPHAYSFEQVARGLHGALVIEEREAPPVDRDLVWLLGDWRLDAGARIQADFGNMMDRTHDGRLGNTVTLNGAVPERFAARPGERLRLRLVNAASARIFALEFGALRPVVIAYDGQPVAPHAPKDGRVVLSPGQRADLIVDVPPEPGFKSTVIDSRLPQRAYRLLDIVAEGASLRTRAPDPPKSLAPNTLPEPDLARAARHDVTFTGGAMGGPFEARLDGEKLDARALIGRGKAWAINGVAAGEHHHGAEPFLTLDRGASCILAMRNDTVWPHPMHLHGHSFRVLSRGGKPVAHREWRDTVLMEGRENMEIAFLADNPGDWMFHCHILDHQEAGMIAHLRVR